MAMESSAQSFQENVTNRRINVLITNIGSYLGSSLADSLLLANCAVYGVGNSGLISALLTKDNFTLLEVDLSQPLLSHLPQFDLIFYLDLLALSPSLSTLTGPRIPLVLKNLAAYAKGAKSKIFICAPITTDNQFLEQLDKSVPEKETAKLLLIGDLYGPKMPLSLNNHSKNDQNELANLITQAAKTDKIILEREGLKMIYPTYITDVVFAINKFVFSPHEENMITITSESAKTSLSVAYEIQNVANVTIGKELGLFFSGGPSRIEPEPTLKIHHQEFAAKVTLTEGLKKTFEYLAKEKQIEATSPQPTSPVFDPESFDPELKTEGLRPERAGGPIPDSLNRQQFTVNQESPRTLKLAKFSLRPRLKTVLLTLVILLLLAIAKTTLDAYLGIRNLESAQKAAFAGDFAKSKKNAKAAASSFKAVSNKTKLLLPFSFVFGDWVDELNTALVSASLGSSGLGYFVEGSEGLVRDYLIIIRKDAQHEGFDLESPSVNFKKSYSLSSEALGLARSVNERSFLRPKLQSAQEAFEKLSALSSAMFELTNLTPNLVGTGKKTYLVLLQNNTELRPGGGFIGNFGLVEFEGGRLVNINVEDIYTIDGQLKEKIEPPRELEEKLAVDNFYLRDSNWSLDFTLNSKTARDFYKKETARNVDGVIAIDLTLIQDILAKIGPIKLEDYDEEITSQNLFERGEYWSEVGFFPGSTQKRDFFGALSRALIAKVTASEKPDNWLSLVQAARDGLSQKHLMFAFDDSELASFVRNHHWDNPLPPVNFNPSDDTIETRDFLALSEANLGANKVNRFLERKISYEMTVGRDADLVARLKISYTNKSQAETWPAGKYVNFLRVYLPFAVDLIEYKNGEITDKSQVEVTTQGGLTTLATFVEVPIKSTKEVSFTYRIPKNIKLEKAPTYHLYVQKQPGTEKDPFEFIFNLPSYLVVKSVNDQDEKENTQNLKISTDLAVDREFEVEVVKK